MPCQGQNKYENSGLHGHNAYTCSLNVMLYLLEQVTLGKQSPEDMQLWVQMKGWREDPMADTQP